MSDYLSFKEFMEASSVKAGQPVAPPKRPRSPKAIVNVPHKRNKAAPKPIGKPLAPPEANTAHKPAKAVAEGAVAESADPKKAKPERAVAIVVPQQSKLSKLLKHYSSGGGRGSTHKSGYAHARRGSISAPARTSSPKNFWGKKLED